jgi:hypothetical protein
MLVGTAGLVRGNRGGFDTTHAEVRELARSRGHAFERLAAIWDAAVALDEGRIVEARDIATGLTMGLGDGAGWSVAPVAQVSRAAQMLDTMSDATAALEAIREQFSSGLGGAVEISIALRFAASGRPDEARRILEKYQDLSHPDAPVGQRPMLHAYAAIGAGLLGDVVLARRLEPWIAPFAGHMIIVPIGAWTISSGDSILGILAWVRGDREGALTLLERGVALERGARMDAVAAGTDMWRARLLLSGTAAQRQRAAVIADELHAFGERAGSSFFTNGAEAIRSAL